MTIDVLFSTFRFALAYIFKIYNNFQVTNTQLQLYQQMLERQQQEQMYQEQQGSNLTNNANQTISSLLETYASPRQENKNVLEDYRTILDNFYNEVNTDGSNRTHSVVKNPLPTLVTQEAPVYVRDDASLFHQRPVGDVSPLLSNQPVMHPLASQQAFKQPKRSIDFLKTATGSYAIMPDPKFDERNASKPLQIEPFQYANPYRQNFIRNKLHNPENIRKRNSSNQISFNFFDANA
jgi:hypothetical protein